VPAVFSFVPAATLKTFIEPAQVSSNLAKLRLRGLQALAESRSYHAQVLCTPRMARYLRPVASNDRQAGRDYALDFAESMAAISVTLDTPSIRAGHRGTKCA